MAAGATAPTSTTGTKEFEKRETCIKNTGSLPLQFHREATYTVTYSINAGASAGASDALEVKLGVEFGTTITRTTGIDASINPGQQLGIWVQYQTVYYTVVWTDWMGLGHNDDVAVTQPTGVLTVHDC
ncbi:hypothetical protein KNE206_40510 [Kitasatospora sp. NE20-6]|uniref:DUF6426 family protein n=1 Tax=Kitasatospora sp. NE20-6 TaxID=2859066 RepID=UPI0034DC952D